MRTITLNHVTDFQGWRTAARAAALDGVPPEQTLWYVTEATDLFAEPPAPPPQAGAFSVPRALVDLAETVIQANDPERFALLYALIWRAHRGEKHLLEDAADPLVQRVMRLAAAVRRDTHKMRAFVRFREVTADDATRYVAWFEPEHYIVEANAPFFVRRFATMTWSILTPYRSAHWDGEALRMGAGAQRADVPDDDKLEAYWRAYFSSIFNPARLKVSAMTSEMPRKYWRNLPEAAAIPELIRQSRERTATMVDTPNVSPVRAPRPHAAARPCSPCRARRARWRPKPPPASSVTCTSTRRRPCSARGRPTRG